MFEKDSEIKYAALNMWANYIETGNINISFNDAINMKNYEILNTLDDFQKEFVIRLRKLAVKELQSK